MTAGCCTGRMRRSIWRARREGLAESRAPTRRMRRSVGRAWREGGTAAPPAPAIASEPPWHVGYAATRTRQRHVRSGRTP
eukprot:4863347-Lingulodinium_polyedra.AAC.1